MKGLEKDECSEYIFSKLKLSGCTRELFDPEAVQTIYNISGGASRVINNISIASLMYSAVKRLDTVDEEAVFQATIEIGA